MGRLSVGICLVLLGVGCGGSPFTAAAADPALSDDGGVVTPQIDAGAGVVDHLIAIPDAGVADAEDAGQTVEGGHDAQAVDVQADAGVADSQVEAAAGCADDLSNVGAGDFRVVFDMLGGGGSNEPLLGQQPVCDQYNVQWGIAETSSGGLNSYFYDGSRGFQLASVAVVNDGAWHHVVAARVAQTFSFTIDGYLDNSTPDAVWSPSVMPLLQVGRSVCASVFSGQIKNVCVNAN